MPINRQAERAKFLLDQDEGNLGNELVVLPRSLSPNPAYPDGVLNTYHANGLPPNPVYLVPPSTSPYVFDGTKSGPGVQVRILNMQGNSKFGAVVTIAMAAHQLPFSADLLGPIVGIVEFGQGSTTSRLEFDVPTGSVPSNKNPDIDSGVILSVPASVIRIYARNDGSLIPFNSQGDLIGDNMLDGGAGGPVGVKAMVVNGTRASDGRVRRLLALASYTGVTPVVGEHYNVPPYAKTVRFLRNPIAAPVSYTFLSGFSGQLLDTGFIPAGVSSPVIDVPTHANEVAVSIAGPGTSQAFADFTIQV